MSMDMFNTFASFVDDATLSPINKISRDLYNYLMANIGSGFFDRSGGTGLNYVENESNSVLEDVLTTVKIVEAVAKYNLQTTPDLRVIVGSDMVSIRREYNKVDILVIFLPAVKPDVSNLSQFMLSVPISGG